jgi:hypothetical protein
MTIRIPKPLVALFALAAAAGAVFLFYEEVPSLRRYIKFETM